MSAIRTVDGRSTVLLRASALLLPVLLAIFFLSGFSGLVYQVVWVRLLALTFGVTTYAIATVLCSFMAGLALGSYLAGRLSERVARPLLWYGAAELLIGVIGVLSPAIFQALQEVYVSLVGVIGIESLIALSLLRFALAFLVLLVPTTLMGATLPLIVRSAATASAGSSRVLSMLYGANTLGATAGVASAGFILIGRYGLQRTLVIAALMNGIAALLAFALAATHTGEQGPSRITSPTTSTDSPLPRMTRTTVTVVFALSGALSLAYEVVWARVLSIFFDATTYAFTIMLTVVLLGISAGSWALSPVIGRRWNWIVIFAAIEAAVGILGLLSIPLLTRIVPLTDALGLYADPGPLGQFSVKFMTLVSSLLILPSMLLLGMTFPIVARIVGGGSEQSGSVGTVYAANLCGAIGGAFVAGFILLPRLGSEVSLLVLASGSILLAVVLLWVSSIRGAIWRWGAFLAGGGTVLAALMVAPDLYAGIFRERFAGQRVLYTDEGLENIAIVTDYLDRDEQKLYLNGQPQASTIAGIAGFHQLIGHTGVLMNPDARKALVIGFGGGATPGALARHPQTQVDVVEISSAVTRAGAYFRGINGDVLNRPNVHLIVDDGRNHLLLTDERYDVITADIIRPRHAGAGNLYSREYFQLAKDALADNGVMVQWLEQLSEQQYKLLLRTFLDVFPYVTIWANGSLLVGSKQAVLVDRAALALQFSDPELAPALASAGLRSPDDFLALYTGDRAEGLAYTGPGPVITDDRPYVEFYRSLSSDGDRLPELSGFSRDWRTVVRP